MSPKYWTASAKFLFRNPKTLKTIPATKMGTPQMVKIVERIGRLYVVGDSVVMGFDYRVGVAKQAKRFAYFGPGFPANASLHSLASRTGQSGSAKNSFFSIRYILTRSTNSLFRGESATPSSG